MFKIIGADQKQYGPVSTAQIRQWVTDGRLNATTMAQRDTGGEWQPLSAFEEFADIFQTAGSAPSAQAAPAGTTYSPAATPTPTASREMALSAVKGPAIALLIIAGIGIALYFLGTIGQLLGVNQDKINQDFSNLPPSLQRWFMQDHGITNILSSLLGMALNGAVLFGAIRMRQLRGHTLAIVTCILAMFPCNCCCFLFNIPFAIWGLVVLNKPEVKSQFTN